MKKPNKKYHADGTAKKFTRNLQEEAKLVHTYI